MTDTPDFANRRPGVWMSRARYDQQQSRIAALEVALAAEVRARHKARTTMQRMACQGCEWAIPASDDEEQQHAAHVAEAVAKALEMEQP